MRRFGTARPARRVAIAALILAATGLAATAAAQFRGFGRFAFRVPPNPPYDGAFQYCRAMYQPHPQGDGGGWTTDYPQADENLPYRFSELTKAIAGVVGEHACAAVHAL